MSAHDFPPPRTWARLLIDPLFGPYFLGRVISTAGVWAFSVTAALLAFDLTGSALVVGLVGVVQFIPQLALAPLSGALADRGNRRRQVIIGRVVIAVGCAVLAGWLASTDASDEADAIVLMVVSFVFGIGLVTGGPAMQALLPSLVRPNEIPVAVALNTVPLGLGRAIGPIIGAAIALGAGPALAFAVAGASNLVFAVALLFTPVPSHTMHADADYSISAGFAFVRRNRGVLFPLIGIAALGFGADPAITLGPSISTVLSGGVAYTGAFASAFGIGAGIAFLLMPLVRRALGMVLSGTAGFFLMAIGLLVLVVAAHPWWAIAGFAASGFGMSLSLMSLGTQLQERTPEQVRGRVMALWSLGFMGSRPLAAALDGALADLVSIPAALSVMMVVLVVAGWLCSPRYLERS